MLSLLTLLPSMSYFSTTCNASRDYLSDKMLASESLFEGTHIKIGLYFPWTGGRASNVLQPLKRPCSKTSLLDVSREDNEQEQAAQEMESGATENN